MKSIKSRKQRKRRFNAPLHKKRKWMATHLAENLLLKYDHRSTPIIKGDTVKVMRGSFKGHEDKVARVDIRKQIVEVEGITTVKSDGTKIAKPVHSSNLLITKLNLTDKWRRKKLERGLSEETKKEIEKEAEEQMKEIEEKEKISEGAIPVKEEGTAEKKPDVPNKISDIKETVKEKEGKVKIQKTDKKIKQEKKKTVKKKKGATKKETTKQTPTKTVKKKKEDKNE